MIRYPVGDIGEWVDYSKMLFRVLGRDKNEVRVGVVSIETNLLRSMIEENLSDADRGSFQGAQLHLEREELRDQLIFKVACNPADSKVAAAALENGLHRLKPWFKDHVGQGLIHPLQVQWVDLDGLDISSRTGKTPLVVDKRQ